MKHTQDILVLIQISVTFKSIILNKIKQMI